MYEEEREEGLLNYFPSFQQIDGKDNLNHEVRATTQGDIEQKKLGAHGGGYRKGYYH